MVILRFIPGISVFVFFNERDVVEVRERGKENAEARRWGEGHRMNSSVLRGFNRPSLVDIRSVQASSSAQRFFLSLGAKLP